MAQRVILTRIGVVERRRRVCRLGPRTENTGFWKCTWCGRANVRHYAGLDHCSECDAEAFTYFTGVENELRVRYSRRRLRLPDGAVEIAEIKQAERIRSIQRPNMVGTSMC